MQACAIWITGLPASGKTTIANLLKDHAKSSNFPVIILDGNEIRKTYQKTLDSRPKIEKNTTDVLSRLEFSKKLYGRKLYHMVEIFTIHEIT
ncbi:MAG: adenylyl-sulfate kinase [Nitrosotalea sp.]